MANNLTYTIDDQRTATQNFTPTAVADVSVLVSQSGSITASSGEGIMIFHPAMNCDVTVNGTVSSADDAGVYISRGQLTVGATGQVSGRNGFDCANPATVINHGTIIGTEDAIQGARGLTILNDGTIQSGRYGIFYGDWDSALNVTNTGTISGQYYAIHSGMSNDVVINKGVLTSEDPITVSLGGGTDLYDSRGGGSASGLVKLGGGDDTAYGGNADDTFEGGAGNDTIDGGNEYNGTHLNTAIYERVKSNYTITRDQSGIIYVEDKTGAEGKDTLKHIKTLKFANGEVETNTAPDSITLSKTSVAENTLVNTIVAELSAHDADGDIVRFGILANDGYFTVNGNQLVLTKALDYETQPHQRTISIQAVDAFGGKSYKSVTINITDVNDTVADPIGPTQPSAPPNPLVLIGTLKRDSLIGKDGNDVIKGLANKDALFGNGGNDMLYGGLGNDVLTGGTGQDVFVFDKKLSKTNALNKKQNSDRITDFSVNDDTIWLSKGAFKGLAKKGVLAKKEFHVGAKAQDGNDHIIYNRKTGALSYDADGKGGKDAIQIATLSRDLKLTESDFFVL